MYFDARDIQKSSTTTASHFTSTLAQYATDDETISVDGMGACYILAARCQSQQQLFWRLWLSHTSAFDSTTYDDDQLFDHIDFDMVADAERYGNGNQYRLTKNFDPPKFYSPTAGYLFLSLENLSSTAKLASGSGGNIKIDIWWVPMVKATTYA